MAVIRWNPWRISSLLEDDFDFPTLPGASKFAQGLNIYETEEAVVAQAALPGIKEDDIDITLDEGVVRITGSAKEQEEQKDKKRYFLSSMTSSYNYSFRLPEGLVADSEPAAEVENGILTLTFKKVEKTPPKKVKVVNKSIK